MTSTVSRCVWGLHSGIQGCMQNPAVLFHTHAHARVHSAGSSCMDLLLYAHLACKSLEARHILFFPSVSDCRLKSEGCGLCVRSQIAKACLSDFMLHYGSICNVVRSYGLCTRMRISSMDSNARRRLSMKPRCRAEQDLPAEQSLSLPESVWSGGLCATGR